MPLKSLKGYNSRPETKLAEKLKKFLEDRGWHVLNTHGNLYQKGLPDKYCVHPKYKQRWVEIKIVGRYKFTAAQLTYFPLLDFCGIGIWILTSPTEEEYAKLFSKPNWKQYLKSSDITVIKEKYPWFELQESEPSA